MEASNQKFEIIHIVYYKYPYKINTTLIHNIFEIEMKKSHSIFSLFFSNENGGKISSKIFISFD